MINKNFDVVVYGATGFTGKLVVEYMQMMQRFHGPSQAEAQKS
jgi:short subunit dehydrogenase-like uncharacterized protein